MPDNQEITCRLLAASAVAYWIERNGGLVACPLYDSVGYASTPTILLGGRSDIDVITVGSTNDGCVVVVCRGTLSGNTGEDKTQIILDWINNLQIKPVPVPGLPDNCRAHEGFLNAVNSVQSPEGKNVFAEVNTQLAAIGDDAKLFITGHFKGGAMSYIAAAQMIAQNKTPTAIITFAAARPGNGRFADYVDGNMSGGEIRRYEVKNDIVPHLPPDFKIWDILEEAIGKGNLQEFADWDYDSVGQLYYYNMEGNLKVPTNSLSRFWLSFTRTRSLSKAVLAKKIEEIINEHSLTGSYGPVICPNLPYGDRAIDAMDGF